METSENKFFLELYVEEQQRGVTLNMTYDVAVKDAKKRMKGLSDISDKENLLPYSTIYVVNDETSVVHYVIDRGHYIKGKHLKK